MNFSLAWKSCNASPCQSCRGLLAASGSSLTIPRRCERCVALKIQVPLPPHDAQGLCLRFAPARLMWASYHRCTTLPLIFTGTRNRGRWVRPTDRGICAHTFQKCLKNNMWLLLSRRLGVGRSPVAPFARPKILSAGAVVRLYPRKVQKSHFQGEALSCYKCRIPAKHLLDLDVKLSPAVSRRTRGRSFWSLCDPQAAKTCRSTMKWLVGL